LFEHNSLFAADLLACLFPCLLARACFNRCAVLSRSPPQAAGEQGSFNRCAVSA